MSANYKLYKSLRAMGLRAIIAFGIAKYGIDFAFALLIDEE